MGFFVPMEKPLRQLTAILLIALWGPTSTSTSVPVWSRTLTWLVSDALSGLG
jgi:hypothetical protein